jgi:hypothetical protein
MISNFSFLGADIASLPMAEAVGEFYTLMQIFHPLFSGGVAGRRTPRLHCCHAAQG